MIRRFFRWLFGCRRAQPRAPSPLADQPLNIRLLAVHIANATNKSALR